MNSIDVERIATLEWANYAAAQALTKATPASNLVLRKDVIITSARLFPVSDLNHACLLRASPETVDPLITEIVDYFKSRWLPVHLFLSPACTPADLSVRLEQRGFTRDEAEEIWITLEDIQNWRSPPAPGHVTVKTLEKRDVWAFARTYLACFGMPVVFTPFMAALQRLSFGLPNVHYYLAYVEGQAAGICLWYSYQTMACLGAAGVVPAHRGKEVATGLVITAIAEAKQQGMQTLLCQTMNPRLERVLHKYGFERVFARTCYSL